MDSRILFSRELDFPKTFSLTENQFSQKTYFYTIAFRTPAALDQHNSDKHHLPPHHPGQHHQINHQQRLQLIHAVQQMQQLMHQQL